MSRFGISAAAFGACAGLATLVGIAGGPDRSTAAPAPLVQVTAKELRLSEPLAAMDAEGKGVAFAFCNQLLGVWRPGASGVTRLGPANQWTCPPPRGLERTYSLAFAGDRVAWIA